MTRSKESKSTKAQGSSKEDVELARDALFSAVEFEDDDSGVFPGTEHHSASPRQFVRLFVSSNNTRSIKPGISIREQKRILLDAVGGFSKVHSRRFFGALDNIIQSVVEAGTYIPESAYQDNDGDCNGDQGVDVTPDPRSSEHLHFLNFAALSLKAYVEGQMKKQPTKKAPLVVVDEAFHVAERLHNVLFSLNSCGPDAVEPQSNIVAVCECWWIANIEHREMLILQALPLVVYATLGEDSSTTKSSVRRLFLMKEAFAVVDFDDESAAPLKSLLFRVASSPMCLKTSEGKRFLAFLLQADMTLLKGIYQAIRVQIPDAKTSILEAYGEIFFRAWKEAQEQGVRDNIESEILSDLIYAVIHVEKPRMVQSLLTILEPFHTAQKTPEVENLLYRMYGPILWRSLSAANYKVRINSAQVLAHVFPLQDSSHTQTNQAIMKACGALKSLTLDRDPEVRAAGSEAVAMVLSTYWDVIPSTEIRSLLNNLVQHASDASSATVRAAAVKAFTLLLDAPQSHAVLRGLLPSIGNLIHDKVERVKLATAQLLLRIKKLPGIKYYHVVPVDHITARLADEGRSRKTGSVASALTKLIANSYFPQGPKVSSAVQVQRTLKFLTSDPGAASVFYANLGRHLGTASIAKLAAMLLRCLHAAVEADNLEMENERGNKKRRKFRGQKEQESSEQPDSGSILSSLDTSLMSRLAETICTLWESIEAQLSKPGNEDSHNFLLDSFSGSTLLDLLTHFETKATDLKAKTEDNGVQEDCYRIIACLLSCAGRLPREAVDGLVPYIGSKLKQLKERDASQTGSPNVTPHIALLCLWNLTDEVASSLAVSIESTFDNDFDITFTSQDDASRKRKSGRSKREESQHLLPRLPHTTALQVLGELLRGSDPSSVSARESIFNSRSASSVLEKSLLRGTRYAEKMLVTSVENDTSLLRSLEEADIEYVLQVCEVFGRFVLHQAASSTDGIKFNDQASTLLKWTNSVIFPALSSSHTEPASPFADLNISRISVAASFDLPSSPIPTGPARRKPNLRKTPSKGDRNTHGTPPERDQSMPDVASAMAVSLLQSCIVVFSEWLAVGGTGAEQIAEAATGWTRICQSTEVQDVRKDLFLPLTRLALQLCKAAGNFSLLTRLLTCFPDKVGDADFEPLSKALSSLLTGRGRGNDALCSSTVKSIIDTAHEVISKTPVEVTSDLPSSVDDLWTYPNSSVARAISCIFASKTASVELANYLTSTLDTTQSNSISVFNAKCLWLLCDANFSKAHEEIALVVRQMNTTGIDPDSELQTIMAEVCDVCVCRQ